MYYRNIQCNCTYIYHFFRIYKYNSDLKLLRKVSKKAGGREDTKNSSKLLIDRSGQKE